MTTQMSQALKLARQSRQMRREASRCKANPVGRRDRNRLADELWAKMLWTLGRVSKEDYLAWLKK